MLERHLKQSGDDLATLLNKRATAYDKDRDEHYNLISALHKSVRGSDPDAAMYWYTRMLAGGEDPEPLGPGDRIVDAIADGVFEAGGRIDDPVWRLPLWSRYDEWMDSPIADLSSTGNGKFAGSITAALFLRRFVPAGSWT